MATINVDESTKYDLKEYCKKFKINQGEFVKLALVYFRKSGINPIDPPESVKEELSKIGKRISQLIAFQRTFEKENMLPLVEALIKTEGKINSYFADLPDRLKVTQETLDILLKQNRQIEQNISIGLQKGFYDIREAEMETRQLLGQQFDIIIDYGAAAGAMGSSIKKSYERQTK